MPVKKSGLYSSLWKSCDELRGGMDASQYKDYVLVLLFMKYVSDKASSQKGYLLDVPKGVDFKRHGPKPTLGEPDSSLVKHPVVLNWYPKIQAQQSRGLARASEVAVLETGQFEEKHLAFMDFDSIYFALQHFKNERGWHNLNLPRASIPTLLRRNDWYRLHIPAAEYAREGTEAAGVRVLTCRRRQGRRGGPNLRSQPVALKALLVPAYLRSFAGVSHRRVLCPTRARPRPDSSIASLI